MTDTAAAEAPAESVPPEAAPAPEAELETEVNKSAREKVLDHLIDSKGPQTVAEIIQGTGLISNTAEQAIFRAVQAGQIERTAPGTYKLAAPKPPRPPGPEPPPPSPTRHTDEEWIARIEAWQVNPACWNIEEDGPPPNDPNHRIPLDVVGRFKDRQAREAKEREKREGATAKQEAADAALRDQLIAATGGNFTPGPALDDVAPIRAAMEIIPLDSILSSIRMKTDRRIYPPNEPATSWRETRLLKKSRKATVGSCSYRAWSRLGRRPGRRLGSSPVRRRPRPALRSPHRPPDALSFVSFDQKPPCAKGGRGNRSQDMRTSYIATICGMGLAAIALSSTAFAQQKSAAACAAEWRANKAANQAAGKTEKAYVAECRSGAEITLDEVERIAI